jgi:hypothetical protein
MPHTAATPVSIAPATGAHATFLTAIAGARPRELRIQPSPDALAGRLFEVEATMAAFKAYLTALLEDTAKAASFSHPMHEIVDRYMSDMADEVRGQFVDAIEDLRRWPLSKATFLWVNV